MGNAFAQFISFKGTWKAITGQHLLIHVSKQGYPVVNSYICTIQSHFHIDSWYSDKAYKDYCSSLIDVNFKQWIEIIKLFIYT